jgi:UDP-2,4-diacetamido-2,4,6-trideoxy-beta-L-altropyranose hydrolase
MGTGHVMRCLTLGSALRGHGAEVSFICRLHDGHLCEVIESDGFQVARLNAPADGFRPGASNEHSAWLGASWQEDVEQSLTAIEKLGVPPDWLIVDHYAVDARWETGIRQHARCTMVIDDLADREHDCEILLDQNLWPEPGMRHSGKVPKHCRQLLGPAYALLRPQFAEARRRAKLRTASCNRILITYGGSDEHGYTLAALDAIAPVCLERPDMALDVVAGGSNPRIADLAHRCAGLPNAKLHVNTTQMAALMEAADLGVGAAGSTMWERACLGLPSIVTPVAENQVGLARHMASIGAVVLVPALSSAGAELIQAVRMCLGDAILRRNLSRIGAGLVDGLGVERTVDALIEPAAKSALRGFGQRMGERSD